MKHKSLATLQKLDLNGFSLPVLLIELRDKHIISIPSQIGCVVGCDFCPSSKKKFVRQLTADEMIALYEFGKSLASPDRPVINAMLSFTGEGEPLLNVSAINDVMTALSNSDEVSSFRICMSGIKHRNLDKLISVPDKKLMLQVSLHTPWESMRKSMIKNTEPIAEFTQSIERNRHKFHEIAWNYVLMRDLNDRWSDFGKLLSVVPQSDPIKLNRLLGEVHPYYPSSKQSQWVSGLNICGRKHFSYTAIGQSINESFVDDLTYDELRNKSNQSSPDKPFVIAVG